MLKMLRWLSGVKREDRIRKKYVRDNIDIVSIVDNMRENRLKWFGHVMKREEIKADK